ncbi:MAG: hypothetical protein JRI23_28820 [Deltaproteobacteria bacterium]|jgi:uncharacterized membrane protein YgcG|nr:hypothetical protein [Deltaproteobacteria bacterium]MBW2536122.1 hypothetical protein [Deltaproteobacteria bacterium]
MRRVPSTLAGGTAFLAAAAVAVSAAHAETITASSCEAADVQAAIESAADDDVVQIPAGECTWTVPVTIGEVVDWDPITFSSPRITLQGAGMGETVIHVDMDSSDDALVVKSEPGNPARVTSMTFTGAKNEGRCQRGIDMGGAAEGWRIDHVQFDYRGVTGTSPGCGISASGVGVIDHCRFENNYTSVAAFGDGDASWERPLALGSCDAVYIEDNTMTNTELLGDGATDAYGGARYVFRNNQVTNARAGHHGLDSGGYRSPHSFEIYDNQWEWTDSNTWLTWRSRGGTGVIHGNTITGDVNDSITFGVVNYRTCCCHLCTNVAPDAYGSSCDPYVPCADPLHTNCGSWGRCDGQSPIDGNTAGMMGYPCLDQTGRSTDMDDDGVQDLEPLYEWDNTVNGGDADVSVNDPWGCADPSMADHIQEGRDFYNDTPRPDYTPCAYPHPLAGGDGGSGGSAGTGGGGVGASAGSGGASSTPPSPEEEGDCGCRVGRSTSDRAWLWPAGLGLLWLRLRRRLRR